MTQRALILMTVLAAMMPAAYAAVVQYQLQCTPTTARVVEIPIFTSGFDHGTQARKP